MKISWLKSASDNKSFKRAKKWGQSVYEIADPEDIDNKIAKLVENDYHTIVITNELAPFSGDIIKKYGKITQVNIIIAPPEVPNA